MISGIVEALGPNVEIYGGSAADDAVAGRWNVFNERGSTGRGFALAGMCTTSPDVSFHGGFIGGYLPTAKRGVVTRAKGRVIAEIDGEPAAAVYDRWTGGIITSAMQRGGSVLLQTTCTRSRARSRAARRCRTACCRIRTKCIGMVGSGCSRTSRPGT